MMFVKFISFFLIALTNGIHLKTKSSRAPPPALASWKVPEYYRLEQLIGRGAYGLVAQALDTRRDVRVAIKRVNNVFDDVIDAKRRIDEVILLSRVNSNYVVKLLDIIVPEDLENFDEFYMVLELCDADLATLFRGKDYLQELHVKTLMKKFLLGIKYLHSVGVLHRDLKPANVLLNQDCTLKVCDLGLSLATGIHGQEKVEPGIELDPHVVTRWYRSPELILCEKTYTSGVDVWSAGCIFAEMLQMLQCVTPRRANRRPIFPGKFCYPMSPHESDPRARQPDLHAKSEHDQMNHILNVMGSGNVPDWLKCPKAKRYFQKFASREGVGLEPLLPNCPPAAFNLVRRMLAFNPADRPSINQVLADDYFNDPQIPDAAAEDLPTEAITLEIEEENKEYSINDLRRVFLQEVQKFHPELVIPQSLQPDESDESTASGSTRSGSIFRAARSV